MQENLDDQIAALRRLGVRELRQRYEKTFGEATAARHKTWLIKRIAWRTQALAEGDLSERARRRAAELARDSDLRMSLPRGHCLSAIAAEAPPPRDRRLPMAGTLLARPYQGRLLEVTVLEVGFEHEGVIYGSLSAAARAITGSHVNGFQFFRLGKYGEPA